MTCSTQNKAKFVLLIAIVAVFVGCNNPERKAQRLITGDLRESLHDWDSYENVRFGSLDSVYTTVMDVPEYAAVFTKTIDLGKQMERAREEMNRYDALGSLFNTEKINAAQELLRCTSELKAMKPRTDSIFSVFVPEFKGWAMEHSFRANNLAGNKSISHNVYYFDKDLTDIVHWESN